ncbi:hypothetical protein WOA01_19715 [Methylocystis sp. IM2]|uniref:hypothetical protein n=1 Tax=Methylocystis sp. IM2 TaxID=3136563 RepID=UPI0030FAB92A
MSTTSSAAACMAPGLSARRRVARRLAITRKPMIPQLVATGVEMGMGPRWKAVPT